MFQTSSNMIANKVSCSFNFINKFISRSSHHSTKLEDVYIVSAVRTPVGSFQGCLSSQPATTLGTVAMQNAIERSGVAKEHIEEVYMGMVAQAGCRQSPARQVVLFSGLPESTDATTINKVCSSGMKSISMAAQAIMCRTRDIMAAGGMESMSNIPYYLFRGTTPYGGITLHDGITYDGLTDVYNNFHMGMCGENIATQMNISRQEQDDYALMSYKRSQEAAKSGAFKNEIVPVSWKDKKGKDFVVSEDEEYGKLNESKFRTLRPAFKKDGSVTAGNSSSLNDGASVLILASETSVKKHNLKPLARISAFADAATTPIDFTIAPSLVIPKLLQSAGVKINDVSLWEINEAFSVVAIANIKKLDLDPSLVNSNGGAVSMGHPIGMSGARIVTHLVHALKPGQKGVAAICNGGGAASSMLLHKL